MGKNVIIKWREILPNKQIILFKIIFPFFDTYTMIGLKENEKYEHFKQHKKKEKQSSVLCGGSSTSPIKVTLRKVCNISSKIPIIAANRNRKFCEYKTN